MTPGTRSRLTKEVTMRRKVLLACSLAGVAIAVGLVVRDELPAMKRELKILRM